MQQLQRAVVVPTLDLQFSAVADPTPLDGIKISAVVVLTLLQHPAAERQGIQTQAHELISLTQENATRHVESSDTQSQCIATWDVQRRPRLPGVDGTWTISIS